jgi:hypothetical protein
MKHILLSIFLTFSISANAQIGNDYSTSFDINNLEHKFIVGYSLNPIGP